MILVFLFLAMGFPAVAFAQQMSSVVINEIAWMGSSVEGVDVNQHWRYEWLELYNAKDEPFKLDGWNVELYREEELYFEIPLQVIITGSGYFLVGASDKILRVDTNYANLGGKFVNSGMKVVVKDNLGNVVDEVDARDGWPAGENESKRTMERIAGFNPAMWQTSLASGGTPKAKNSTGFFIQKKPLDKLGVNKKDLAGSLYKESLGIFSSSFPLAFLLALGSGVGVLYLKRFLARQF